VLGFLRPRFVLSCVERALLTRAQFFFLDGLNARPDLELQGEVERIKKRIEAQQKKENAHTGTKD